MSHGTLTGTRIVEIAGTGPEVYLERSPRLVYGRMTGWGQDGPLTAPLNLLDGGAPFPAGIPRKVLAEWLS